MKSKNGERVQRKKNMKRRVGVKEGQKYMEKRDKNRVRNLNEGFNSFKITHV